jgi:hypothetical protein
MRLRTGRDYENTASQSLTRLLENIFIIMNAWTSIVEFPESVLVYCIVEAVPVDVVRKIRVRSHPHEILARFELPISVPTVSIRAE